MNLEGRKAGTAESAEPVRITLGDLTGLIPLPAFLPSRLIFFAPSPLRCSIRGHHGRPPR
jgi:hypothetical protein